MEGISLPMCLQYLGFLTWAVRLETTCTSREKEGSTTGIPSLSCSSLTFSRNRAQIFLLSLHFSKSLSATPFLPTHSIPLSVPAAEEEENDHKNPPPLSFLSPSSPGPTGVKIAPLSLSPPSSSEPGFLSSTAGERSLPSTHSSPSHLPPPKMPFSFPSRRRRGTKISRPVFQSSPLAWAVKKNGPQNRPTQTTYLEAGEL